MVTPCSLQLKLLNLSFGDFENLTIYITYWVSLVISLPCPVIQQNRILSSSHAPCFPNSLLSPFPESGMSSNHQQPITLNQNDLPLNSITTAILLHTPILAEFCVSVMVLMPFPWFYYSYLYCYVCRVFTVCLALFMNILLPCQPINSIKGKTSIYFISITPGPR